MGMAWERHGMCELAFNVAGERHGMCESAFKVLQFFWCGHKAEECLLKSLFTSVHNLTTDVHEI
jgi:hypothetical protein